MFKKGAAVVSSKVEQGKAELPPPPTEKLSKKLHANLKQGCYSSSPC